MSIVAETFTITDVEHINIDWNKITSFEDLKTVMHAFYGKLGLYTSDPEMLKFKKGSNE